MRAPEGFVENLRRYDPPWLATLVEALDGEPSVALRLNRRKSAPGETPVAGRQVPWCERGYLLPQRPQFIFDPAMHQGVYYVQDASSMFVSHVIKSLVGGVETPLRVLDACAAPGGKTTAVIDALPDGSTVVANEYVAKRAAILEENLAKWGYPLVTVTRGEVERFRLTPGYFDLIVADVPCSGEGMMRKDDDAVNQWSPALVSQCAELQRQIVANLWPALKPGGYMIYSTCTFNPTEDEEMLAWLHDEYGAEPVGVALPDSMTGIAPKLTGDMPACRFIPGLIEGEGLFMGVVRKPSDAPAEATAPRRKAKERKQRVDKRTPVPETVSRWIDPKWGARLSVVGDMVMAAFAQGEPYEAKWPVAQLRGRDAVPTQQLAMSQALAEDAFARVEVDRALAIDYLRCEAVRLPDDTPRGVVLLTYGGRPLGFAKNLGNRANNLYPRPWRILSSAPAELTPVPLG